jgi:hypothetical protein
MYLSLCACVFVRVCVARVCLCVREVCVYVCKIDVCVCTREGVCVCVCDGGLRMLVYGRDRVYESVCVGFIVGCAL